MVLIIPHTAATTSPSLPDKSSSVGRRCTFPMASDSAVGFACAVASALFNGSFTSAFKIPSVDAVDLHPVWFTVYVAGGVFLSSWLALPFLKHNR